MRTSFVIALLPFYAAVALVAAPLPALAAQPITTDSRIKTLVYNPNDVFRITTHYGYQGNIEFGPKETIETISVGDRVAWQISPAGRRLFIRAQEENAHTNMTVVTNLRAYQFDLRSSASDAVFGSEELTYVVRFFYPEENPVVAPVEVVEAPPQPIVMQQSPLPPVAAPAPALPPLPKNAVFNYNYTYSGANSLAPVKIFDDGKATYFKFTGAEKPKISIVTAKGEPLNLPTYLTPDGLVGVHAIASQFTLTRGGQQVVVYNEARGAL